MLRKVPCTAAVGFCRSAGLAEILYEGLTCCELLLLLGQAYCIADGRKSCRISAIHPVHHGAFPLIYRSAESDAVQTAPLEGGIIRVLRVVLVIQRRDDIRWYLLPAGQVDDPRRFLVQLVSKEENTEVGRLDVPMYPSLRDIHTRIGLNID